MKSKRIISPFLVFILMLTMIPMIYATDTADTAISQEESYEVEENITETDTEGSALDPALVSAGFTTDSIESSVVNLETASTFSMTRAATKTGTLRNCDQMNMRLNGSVAQGFHFFDMDGKAPWEYSNMLYCLEQYKSFSIGIDHTGSGNLPIDGTATNHGESVWYGLSADQRIAIGLILLYGAPTKIWDYEWGFNAVGDWNMHNPNIGYRFATQALVWEITGGARSPTPPYTRNRSYWYDLAVGMCVSEDGTIDYFKQAYDQIVNDLQQHNTIPSFTGDFAATAPEIVLSGNGITLTDSNSVLSKFTFTNTEGVSYTKNGNDLTIAVSGAVPTTVQNAIATLPDPKSTLYEVWSNEFDYTKQACVKIAVPASDPVPAYFKLKPSSGSLSLKKTTEDGQNLSGWRFGIYSDAECTKLLSGPHTTDAGGNISVSGLMVGDVWVREEGHADAEINAQYKCDSPNPQRVTIVSGQSASVSFLNKLRKGTVKIIKTLADPSQGTVEGWTFGFSLITEENGKTVYKNVATATTGKDGIIMQELEPGDYIVTEVLDEGSAWESISGASQTIRVEAGQTAEVSFVNALRNGRICIQKVNTRGEPLEGVEFLLEWSQDGTNWAPVSSGGTGSCSSPGLKAGKVVSGADGVAAFEGLNPKLLYRLTETQTLPGYELLQGVAYEGPLPEDECFMLGITVVNAESFKLPSTGGASFKLIPAAILIAAFTVCGAFFVLRKREIE